ncbi:SMP-30/gluconolactonase/LRE family protein [Croceicoccus sp. BE223]|uniref:SMP-30/gluconolactonase/LRE family protein n=1 Tax=Croceicoccus sp. BE223 TaxID=2817716 RepID=UPI00286D5619|nr:SMP-30/gluconolactonase/LRE family protein [Croceicoccus sp. BE223]
MQPIAAAPCAASETGIEKICGIPIPEDLVQVPGTRWVIATSMPRDGTAGGLFLVNTRTREVEPLTWAQGRGDFASNANETTGVAGCAAPNPARLIAHGIDIAPGVGGLHRLYLVAHGGRESIELFDIDANGAVPSLHWAGCVPMPEGLEANSVAALPDGGLLFTSLYDEGPADWPRRMSALDAARPAGAVYEWHAAKGIAKLPLPRISGPNGVAVSADGKVVYVAAWGERSVRRFDRAGNETAAPIALTFLVDNLRWAPDGTLLAAGQETTVARLFSCSSRKAQPAYCSTPWAAAGIDPHEFTSIRQWRGEGNAFGDTTSAIMVDGRLWLGSLGSDCIAVLDPDAGQAR